MFGLGPWEILVILAVVAFMGGPSAVKKLARLAQSANKAKNELTGQAFLGRVLDPDDDEGRPERKKKRRTKKPPKRAASSS